MRIGILGGGQLARMMALSCYRMGYTFKAYDTANQPCASDCMPCVQGDYTDINAVANFIDDVDVVTFENENIPIDTAKFIASKVPFFPSIELLAHSQDRLKEKTMLRSLGFTTADFLQVDTVQQLANARQHFNGDLILKTRTLGYDGKGQYRLDDRSDLASFAPILSQHQYIAEAIVPFEREVSLVSVRDKTNRIIHYPLSHNVHENGILAHSSAPYADPQLQNEAQNIMRTMLEHFNYIGVCTIEFFVDAKKRLIINEIAPRVHNSGHWTIDGTNCSQFESHIRAISGLPLKELQWKQCNYMHNCIGSMPSLHAVEQLQAAYLHNYNKKAKPGRKLGHINISCDDLSTLSNVRKKLDNIT